MFVTRSRLCCACSLCLFVYILYCVCFWLTTVYKQWMHFHSTVLCMQIGFKFMHPEGPSEGKSGTKPCPVPLKSSAVLHWLCKPLPSERVVIVAGGHPGRSAGVAQGLPACFLATVASTAGHHNKDSGLSQHLAFLSGPWRQSQTHVHPCTCAYTHNCAWELTMVPHEGLGLSSDKT